MSQDLFNGKIVGVYLDAITPGMEKRKSGDTKVVHLALRVAPFTSALAAAIDDGIAPSDPIKPLLYKLSDGEQKGVIGRLALKLGVPRQRVLVYASSDTVVESIAFHLAQITGITVRGSKDGGGYVLTCRATFGPVGKTELEYLYDWYLGQRFAKFDQAEPSLEFSVEDGTEQPSDADEKARESRPAMEWDDDGTGSGRPVDGPTSVGAVEEGARVGLHSGRGGRRNRRESPDLEARRQREAGAQIDEDVADPGLDDAEQVAH